MAEDPRLDRRPDPLVDPGAADAGRAGRNRQLRVELTGPIGCLVGSLLLILALVILAIIAIAGLIALSVAFWLAAALVAIGAVSALLRRRRS